MQHNLVIYTVITGHYDALKQPQVPIPGADFVLFTDNPLCPERMGQWRTVHLSEPLDAVLLSRKVKMLPHLYLPDYTYSIYLDADMQITGPLDHLLVHLNSQKPMAVYRSSQFCRVQDEARSLLQAGRILPEVWQQQWQRYVDWGFNDAQGQSENGIIVRQHHHPKLQALMQLWWTEFCQGARRDQLSLMPCVHRLQFNGLTLIEGNIWQNSYVRIQKHLAK